MAGPEWFARMANPLIQNARNRNRLLGGLESPGDSPTSTQYGPPAGSYGAPGGNSTPSGSGYTNSSPQTSTAPTTFDDWRTRRQQEQLAAQNYFNTMSAQDQANIRSTWNQPYTFASPGGSVHGSIAPERAENMFMRDWYRNALAAGSVPQTLTGAIAPLQSVQPNTSPQVSQSNPLASLMQTISAAPTETYESMKAKYGVQAAREWERNQGR